MNDEETIFELLQLSGVPLADARQRAICLVEDLKWISFEKFLLHSEHSGLTDEAGRSIPLVEYSFGTTLFNVDNAANSHDKRVTSMSGSLLDRGNLRFLSLVSQLARRLLPNAWLHSKSLKYYLRNPSHHLNTLNEIWWLGRFPTAVDVHQGYRMHSGPEDVDWRFRLDGTDVWVNLEVKNRPADLSRHAHGTNIGPAQWLSDVAKKFTPSCDNEINVLGLTLFGQIDHKVQESISLWLLERPRIDGILIWSHEGRNKSDFDRQCKDGKAKILNSPLVIEPAEERQLFLRNWTVLDRKYWTDEMLASLPADL